MCMVDDAERSVRGSVERRRARKLYRCCECRGPIRPGDTYTRSGMLYDGRWSTYRQCAACDEALAWLTEHCGGWCYTGVYEDLDEHFRDWPAANIEVGRILVRMRRRERAYLALKDAA